MARSDKEIEELEQEEKTLQAELKARLTTSGDVYTKIVLTPKQTEFVEAGEKGFREVLFSGGAGSGKSMALLVKLLDYVSYPNTTVALIRQNYTDLQRSTIRLLKYGEVTKTGDWREPLLFPSEIESDNKITGVITLTNGSVIICMGVADGDKIKSLNCAAVFVEELSQITRDSYLQTIIRPRMPHPLGNKIYCATNPMHKGHWVYKHFCLDRVATRKMICVSSDTNPYLPDDYTDHLNTLDEDTKKRMLLGEWSDCNDSVFNHFSQSKIVANCRHLFTPEHMAEIVVGQDLGGGRQYAGFVLAGRGHDGKIYIGQEFQKKAILIRDMLQWQDQFRGLTSTVVYDKNNSQFGVSEMQNQGWKCVPSFNDVEASCSHLNNLFANSEIVIDPSCNVLIQEIENAYRNSETGRIVKTKDWDILDATRYAAWHLSDMSRDNKTVTKLRFGCL